MMNTTNAGRIRTRWAAIGAAVAVTLGGGGIAVSQAATGTGPKPVFVAMTPCRLVDTRPTTQIGPRNTPIGAGDTLLLRITGSTGECAGVPDDAVAAAMNVTAVQGTEQSFLSVYPADAPLPNASNLNWRGGDPPTPNKVDVRLSPDGEVRFTNAFGTVHVAADLVGYYVDHHHDDRYYRKQQVDAALADKAAAADVYTTEQVYTKAEVEARLAPGSPLELHAAEFNPGVPSEGSWSTITTGWRHTPTIVPYCVSAPLDLPAGAEITTVSTLRNSTGGPSSVRILGTPVAEGPSTWHTAFVTTSGWGPTAGERAWNVQGVDGDDDPTLRRGNTYRLDVCSEVSFDLVAVRVAWN